MENKITKKKSFLNDTFLFSILSVALGLLVGAIALILSGHNPITVYAALIDGIIGKPKYMAWTIIRATPLILTGLSIAFAFKTGLFNIGAEGQFIVGSLVAVLSWCRFRFTSNNPYTTYFALCSNCWSIMGWNSRMAKI